MISIIMIISTNFIRISFLFLLFSFFLVCVRWIDINLLY